MFRYMFFSPGLLNKATCLSESLVTTNRVTFLVLRAHTENCVHHNALYGRGGGGENEVECSRKVVIRSKNSKRGYRTFALPWQRLWERLSFYLFIFSIFTICSLQGRRNLFRIFIKLPCIVPQALPFVFWSSSFFFQNAGSQLCFELSSHWKCYKY